MRIGFDFTAAVNQGAGIGRYTRDLLSTVCRLDEVNDYVLVYAANSGKRHDAPVADSPRVKMKPFPYSERTMAILWYRLRLPIAVERFTGPIDVYHSPDYTLPPLKRAKGIVTVHDLSFLMFPECHEKNLRSYLEKVVPWSVSRSSLVLADSQNTLNDVVCLLDIDQDRVRVVYPGVSPSFARVTDQASLEAVRAKYGLERPFVLFVGMLEPRKNLSRLLQAYARLKSRVKLDHQLVIGGKKGWLYDDIFRRATELGLEADVVFTGFVPDEDLPALYSAADAFVFPSLYEGFGLPVLEAMACGTPVITSNVSSLPEITGDAGLLVNPTDIEDITEALAKVLNDTELRGRMTAVGLDRARLFTWDSAARGLLDAYDSLKE